MFFWFDVCVGLLFLFVLFLVVADVFKCGGGCTTRVVLICFNVSLMSVVMVVCIVLCFVV